MGTGTTDPSAARRLLDQAAAARAAGDLPAARVAYVQAYDAARADDDGPVLTEAALGLAASQVFGFVPGRAPAFLHEAYTRADGVARARLAVALARAWVYGGHPERAVEFAAEAVATAREAQDPALLADALDAELLVHWGPDDLAARLAITSQLEDVVAHLPDVEARMSAHLWRLTTALEALDRPTIARQVRSLDLLAAETGSARTRFFAASRRAMYALLTGNLAEAEAATRATVAAGTEAGEADTMALEHALTSTIAMRRGDLDTLRREATSYEEIGTAEGVRSIAAEGAVRWLACGEPERAERLLHQLAGSDLGAVPRDVDWLLTITSLTRVAAAVGALDLAGQGIRLLEPYAGRGIANAGAVAFEGVVDEYLYLACAATGSADAEHWRASAVAAYDRLGATWWRDQVAGDRLLGAQAAPEPTTGTAGLVAHLAPGPGGVWSVGLGPSGTAIRESKGLHYLRLLVARPGAELTAQELSDAVAGHPGLALVDRPADEVVDRQALAAYRRRLDQLADEIDRADARSEPDRSARLHAERTALLDQLRQATGLGGRSRQTTDAGERARVAVRKAISTAVTRVDEVDPVLGRLLRDTVSTGAVCRYQPDPGRPVRWVLEAGGVD